MDDDHFGDESDSGGLFDDDPALDYILYKKIRQKRHGRDGNGGCLGTLIIFLLPVAALWATWNL